MTACVVETREANGFYDPTRSALLNRIYAQRGVQDASELDYRLATLPSYHAMKGAEAAAARLLAALETQACVVIVGDYDADGATSTALMMAFFKAVGHKNVHYVVPDRFRYGYGLTPPIVDWAMTRFKPDVLVTVDNGISSLEGVAHARSLGVDVVVTDHHLPGAALPEGCIIVNPNQPGDAFPDKHLAGVGVAFYVLCALRAAAVQAGFFASKGIAPPNMASFLDLVALGTVADVVPLSHLNRTLVAQGLARMRAGKARLGIKALLAVSGREAADLVAQDLGFAVGPRLNAAGRLEDMAAGIATLLAETPEAAEAGAATLHALNQKRRTLEAGMRAQALDAVACMHPNNKAPAEALCLHEQGWHEGIVGLVASRIKDAVYRPVLAFAQTAKGLMKGSGRSIPGVHVRDLLVAVDTQYPGLIVGFGGHAMAAGLSIRAEDYTRFQDAWLKVAKQCIDPAVLHMRVQSDGVLAVNELSMAAACDLEAGGPWGQAFPEPVFEGVFPIIEQRIVGEQHLKLRVQVPGTQRVVDAIAFFVDLEQWPNHRAQTVHMLYRLARQTYRGRTRLQLMVERLLDADTPVPQGNEHAHPGCA